MRWTELLLAGVAGWSALGVVGMGISAVRGERTKVVRGVAWMVGVWMVYVLVLLGVSLAQPQRVLGLGQDQCFGDLCYAVMGVDEVPEFFGRNQMGDGSRLVRVAVRVRNRGKDSAEAEKLVKAYLLDGQGRRWAEVPGLTGNRLTRPVAAGGEMVSEPVFKVAGDARGLALGLTRGPWQPGVLVIGDSDSWWHKRTVVSLGR